ncbi:MAG: hypothetical protein H6R26_524, partial [Proteobacteria bacterium]|nr:hypothetical protein [Pseudomonadota bacterium]
MDYRLLVGITLISLALAAPSVDAQPVPSASATPPTSTVAPPSPQTRSDARIVIDTSGSMKQTDPKNLRVPALKLLVNLLPEGSRAGIWLFDTTPRELVPVAPVNKEWKARAEAAATKIDSRGAFTNIEAALAAATAGWAGDAVGEGRHRHLILLTDGMVDVAKDRSINDASRDTILNQKLPTFQQAEVTIHTIALSDQSDRELLHQLALATGGWNAVAENAEQLQRTFLEIFNQAAPHDSIPIRDNRFTVDSSVQEFTLLVLLKPGANPTSMTAPDGSPLTQGRVPENARWLHEAGYDLITVTNPLAGDWKLNAAVDPGNQVFVVANLKMEPADIPSYLQAEDKPDIAATFTESGHPITREDFLSLLTLRAELREAAGKRDLVLSRDADRSGTFKADVSEPLTPGEYTLLITADGRTFQRETRQAFRVMSDMLQVTTTTDASSDPPGLIILLTPNPDTLALDDVTVQA